MKLKDYHVLFLSHLQQKVTTREPNNLYQPVEYILNLGGKRLRPLLTLIATDAFGGNAKKALDAALAIEVFHNFTLLHDDIMDEATIRRGKPTVHEKWNTNTGILSGDVMLINSYQYLENYSPELSKKLNILFSKTAVEVCEGQQYDMDFETRNNVTLAEYLKMIEYKTSVLVATALQMGAMIAEASKKEQEQIYRFGIATGMAFQLQDDYLDTFGKADTFGKQIGGDILEGKKTWLYLKTLEKANTSDKNKLLDCYKNEIDDEVSKIKIVTDLFKKYNIDKLIKREIKSYSDKAIQLLEKMIIQDEPRNILKELVVSLEKRNQ